MSGRRGDAPLVGRYLVSRERSGEDHAPGGEDEGALPSRMAAGDDPFMARARSRPAKVRVDRRRSQGSVDAYVLQVDRAREAGEDVWEICDATSANLFGVCEAVFDEAGELKDEVCDAGIG